jgi:hypothetical protein
MSSTNRGNKRSEADWYATPLWCVYRLLDEHIGDAVDLMNGISMLEPCAGDGAIVRAVNTWLRRDTLDRQRDPVRWTVVDLREEMRKSLIGNDLNPHIGDFFEWVKSYGLLLNAKRPDGSPLFDVVLTNPPFSLAMEFIRACMPIATHKFFLLRLNFLGSEERSKFIRETRPDIYVLPNRPSFTGGGTDSIEYAWWHFFPGSTGIYRILPSTPMAERRR